MQNSDRSPHGGHYEQTRSARHRTAVAAVAIFVTSLAGCIPPKAIASYSAAASIAIAASAPVATDFYTTCLRYYGFQLRRKDIAAQLDSAAVTSCSERKAVADSVTSATKVLSAYCAALAAMADDKVVSYDPVIDTLATAIGTVRGVGSGNPQVKALAGLAKVLFSATTDGFRRKQLAGVITSQNESILTVVAALQRTVDAYESALDLERQGMELYYGSPLRNSASAGGPDAAAVLLRETWDSRVRDWQAKRAAVDGYRKALTVISKGHQALYASRSSLDAKALATVLGQYAKSLDASITALQKVF